MEFEYGILASTEPVGSLREHVHISAPVDTVWARILDVPNNSSWFTSIERSWCEADPLTGRPMRLVKVGSGATLTEDIVRVDSIQRRLQYRLRPFALITHHLATIDVIDTSALTGSASAMVLYSTELAPAALAVAFGGATRRALDELKLQLEEEQN
jgi:Polyketide cyclase / dehydrase and lipid transport